MIVANDGQKTPQFAATSRFSSVTISLCADSCEEVRM